MHKIRRASVLTDVDHLGSERCRVAGNSRGALEISDRHAVPKMFLLGRVGTHAPPPASARRGLDALLTIGATPLSRSHKRDASFRLDVGCSPPGWRPLVGRLEIISE